MNRFPLGFPDGVLFRPEARIVFKNYFTKTTSFSLSSLVEGVHPVNRTTTTDRAGAVLARLEEWLCRCELALSDWDAVRGLPRSTPVATSREHRDGDRLSANKCPKAAWGRGKRCNPHVGPFHPLDELATWVARRD